MASYGYVLCILLGSALTTIMAFPTGAPDFQCDEMRPGHTTPDGTRIDSQPSTSLPVAVTCFDNADGTIHVALDGSTFKGTLIQIRNEAGDRLGQVEDAGPLKPLCDGQALTHTDNLDKTSVEVSFKLTEEERSQFLQCFVTVVESFERFWVQSQAPVQ